jgi:hypothetical protein
MVCEYCCCAYEAIDPDLADVPVTAETMPPSATPGLSIDEQNLLNALTSAMPTAGQAQGDNTVNMPPFELDENTMRSLQQFIATHGLNTESQATEEQVICVRCILYRLNHRHR